MQVFWHRRDLRCSDNRGLAAAADAVDPSDPTGGVIPVFCFDDVVLQYAAPPRVAFMLDALHELREEYRERGSDLYVYHGDPSNLLPDIAAEYDADRVVWNHDYSGLSAERDNAVRAALTDAGIPNEEFHDAVLHEPGTIRTNDGDPYQVYSYFWKKWRDRDTDPIADTPSADALRAGRDDNPLPTCTDLGFDTLDATLPPAGTDAAQTRLDEFLEDAVYEYAEARDYPADRGTSRLSQDLTFGTIGIRTVYGAVQDAYDAATDDTARESVREFESQLAWREFYTQVLAFNPGVVTQNYNTYPNDIQWRNDPDELVAWKAGETGYPIVDAGMRQLREEAYMHNRVRMIVASFLTKDLLWDWRAGYDHFREHLVDHDTANDNGGWQWAASTGTDAQPYFRVFNPQIQGERYDPAAKYITRYVPELADVDPDAIHAWSEHTDEERNVLAPDYAHPIVDHACRRAAAIAAFEAARGDN